MNLTIRQYQELYTALHDDYVLATFDQLLQLKLNRRREDITTGIGVGFTDVLMKVLKAAERDSWIRDLIQHALDGRTDPDLLVKFVRKYPELDPSRPLDDGADWYQTSYLREKRVLLRREPLRDNMRSIGKPKRSRVMLVNGPRVSGKTYTIDFISYIIENHPDERNLRQRVVYLDLDEFSVQPDALAERIGRGMNWHGVPDQGGEQATRWVTPLRDWLIEGFTRPADAKPDPPPPVDVWWLVFDGFRLQNHPLETYDLIAKLVHAAENELSNVKIVLLNYGDRLPPKLHAFVLHEEIPVIVREDIEAFIDRVYADAGKEYDESNVTQAVDLIFAQVDQEMQRRKAPAEEWLTYLGIALNNAARQLTV